MEYLDEGKIPYVRPRGAFYIFPDFSEFGMTSKDMALYLLENAHIGVVPEDQNVTLAAAFGTPLIAYTNRGAAKACEAIAKRLEGRHVPLSFFDFF